MDEVDFEKLIETMFAAKYEQRIMALEAALEFYADKNNYEFQDSWHVYTAVENDNGRLAREVLNARNNAD